MTRKITLTLMVAITLFGMSGCALRLAMHHIGEHYKAARVFANRKAYADADAEVGKVAAIFSSDVVVNAYPSARFAKLHARLAANLVTLREKLRTQDEAQAMAAFKVTTASCKACHKVYR